MFDNFGLEISKVFKSAEKERLDLKHPYVGSEHLLLAILKTDNDLVKKMAKYNLTYDSFKEELIRVVGKSSKKSDYNLYTPLLKRVILNALEDAKEEDNPLTIDHLIISLIEEGEGIAIRLMIGMDIDLDSLYKEIKLKKKNPKSLEVLEIGTLLNETINLDEVVVGREEEINRIIETLLRKKKNNPLLVGKAGVGKSAIVEELTRRIVKGHVPDELIDKKIVMLEMGSLVAGTKYRGEFEERLTKIIREIKEENNIILFIDEIHTMINAGGAEGAINASDILKPYLATGSIMCIGATTINEYNKTIAKDNALERRFEYINVDEPTNEETKTILKAIKKEYENHHKIKITNDNINDIVDYATEFIPLKSNPDKSIDLLDTVCAKVKSNATKRVNKKDLELLKKQKDSCIANNNFKEALKLHQEEIEYKKSLLKMNVITIDDILDVIASKSNVPIFENINIIYNHIKKNLEENIFGQNEAIQRILNYINQKLQGTDKPLALLLTGPTGVGKTQTVKLIANSLNKKSKLIRLDMSEYTLDTSVNKLIGSPAGYVGYDDDYILKQVRINPSSVILLDEIEKAHPRVLNLFLQILDEGFITDNKGEKIFFNKCFIFMTSNLICKNQLGFANQKDINFNDVLSDELISRIDDIIPFNRITESTIKEYLKAKKINIDINKLLKEANYQKYGMRNIKKLLNKYNSMQTN